MKKCDKISAKVGDLSLYWCYLLDNRARDVSFRAFFYFLHLFTDSFESISFSLSEYIEQNAFLEGLWKKYYRFYFLY